jgi:hypothetical protein
MNSWGSSFADEGFFRVKDQQVLNDTHFFDIYWTLDDLKPCEIEAYEIECAKKAKESLEKFPSIGKLLHECPNCKYLSEVREYHGNIRIAECPKCRFKFKPTNEALLRCLEYK